MAGAPWPTRDDRLVVTNSPRLWVVVAALVFLHFFLHVGLGWGAGAPDLLVIALLVSARELGMGSSSGVGFALGVLEDSFSSLAFGANALTLTLIGAMGARTRELFVGDSLAFLVSYLFLGKWMRDLLQWVAVGEGLREPFLQTVVFDGIVSAGYATAVGIGAFVVAGVRWGRLN